MKASRLLILTAAAALALGAPALAFHDGGVAHCNGCHTMHNSQNGEAMNFAADGSPGGTPVGQGHPDLLLFANKTDVCLNCHAGSGGGYHIWSDDLANPDPIQANRGGGDFVFLEEDNINDAHAGASNPVPGYAAGHSVVSGMMMTPVDPENPVSPGGNYDARNLACSSCHDPHGTSSYRILYQAGQSVDNAIYNATVEAEGISLFGPGESPTHHNAYLDGFSEWCGTCHGDFHSNSGNLIHPSGEPLGEDIANTYNSYDGTTDCVNNPPAPGQPCGTGSTQTAYLIQVPFQDPSNTTSSTAGPISSSEVACMTCHRAHATSAMDAGRWDFNITGLAEDGHESSSYAIPNPYDAFQRSLCNKCHAQDEFDELVDFTP